MAIDIARIRNVGFVGHGGVGKTSLVEAILFRNGMTSRLGRVDDGTATTDFDPEEVKRKISINIGVAHCDYREHRFNFVDMPGYGDFIAEARAGLRVVVGAVLVVDAVAGVEVQTEKVSKFAQERRRFAEAQRAGDARGARRAVLSVLLHTLYAGRVTEAWCGFDRGYRWADRADVRQEVLRRLRLAPDPEDGRLPPIDLAYALAPPGGCR